MFSVKKISSCMAALLAVMVFSAAALADGEGPPRPATAAEKAHFAKYNKAMMALLPAMPKGWEKRPTDITPLKEMSASQDKYPWSFSVECLFEKKQPVDMGQMNRDMDTFGDMTGRINALMAKMNEAMASGNQAEMERIQAEMQNVAQNSEGGERYQDIEAENRRNNARITITVNSGGFDNIGFHSIAAPPHAKAAVRRISADKPGEQSPTAYTFIFVGPFSVRESPENIEVYPDPKWRANHYMKIQTVLVAIEAVSEVCDDIIKRIDWKAAAGLIK